jgi:hypothetical protein
MAGRTTLAALGSPTPGKPVSKSIFSALSFSLRAKQSSPKEAAAIVGSTKKLR